MSDRDRDAAGGSRRSGAAYTFGDSDQAAARLALVAEVFEPTTRPFMAAAGALLGERPGGERRPGLAIDLGCGPGHTTWLLAETLRPRSTVGLDRSAAFVDLARHTVRHAGSPTGRPAAAVPGAAPSFLVHDVTRFPLPPGDADVLYCRFLLSHLERPAEALAGWASQLRPGGVLLLDEVDWIDPRHPILRDYLAAVAAMLAGQGQALEVGPLLHALPTPAGVERVASRVATLEPGPARAATAWPRSPTTRATRGSPGACARSSTAARRDRTRPSRRLPPAAPARRYSLLFRLEPVSFSPGVPPTRVQVIVRSPASQDSSVGVK
jgi:trans-aconitate 2-methyltransferase